jgi:hypothetical protein
MYLVFFAALMLLFAGCGPKGPELSELRPKFIGEYCGPDRHKLILNENGTYRNQVTVKSPYTGAPLTESCEGNFTFAQESDGWFISFGSSTKESSIMVRCDSTRIKIWSPDGGYELGDSLPVIPDLMGGVLVKKGDCL